LIAANSGESFTGIACVVATVEPGGDPARCA
jgi:hypothetical protein